MPVPALTRPVILWAALVALVALAAATAPVLAREPVVLSLEGANGARATITFGPDARAPDALVIATRLAGVAGSRLALTVDRVQPAPIDRILTDAECRFEDGASVCAIAIDGQSRDYAVIVDLFRRGRTLRLEIENAGLMAMQSVASLIGFTRAYGRR